MISEYFGLRIRFWCGFTICVNHRESTESEEKHSEMEETDLKGHSWVILKQGFHTIYQNLWKTTIFVGVIFNTIKYYSKFKFFFQTLLCHTNGCVSTLRDVHSLYQIDLSWRCSRYIYTAFLYVTIGNWIQVTIQY